MGDSRASPLRARLTGAETGGADSQYSSKDELFRSICRNNPSNFSRSLLRFSSRCSLFEAFWWPVSQPAASPAHSRTSCGRDRLHHQRQMPLMRRQRDVAILLMTPIKVSVLLVMSLKCERLVDYKVAVAGEAKARLRLPSLISLGLHSPSALTLSTFLRVTHTDTRKAIKYSGLQTRTHV
jgi:hypothetical protein